MNSFSLSDREVGQVIVILARLGISQDEIAQFLGVKSFFPVIRCLNEAGYARFANIPGWQRSLSRHKDIVAIRITHYLSDFDRNAMQDDLSDEQKKILKSSLQQWLERKEDENSYRGYHPSCDRKVVIRRLRRLGITYRTIPAVSGYDFGSVRADLRGYRTDTVEGIYASVFQEYLLALSCREQGIVIEEGIGDIDWYLQILERFLKKEQILAYTLGVWQVANTLKVPSFSPEERFCVRLFLVLANQPTLLDQCLSFRSLSQVVKDAFDLYAKQVAKGDLPFPQNEWEVTSQLTQQRCEELRGHVWPCWKKEWSVIMDRVFTVLSEKETYLIRGLYGFDGTEMSVQDLVNQWHHSRQKIIHLHLCALRRMRKTEEFRFLVSLVSPCDFQLAQKKSADQMQELLERIAWMQALPQEVEREVYSEDLLRRVDELELSVRLRHCLENEGIEYVYQLVQQTERDMLRIKNFGRKCLYEVKEILAELGLQLDMRLPKTFVPPVH